MAILPALSLATKEWTLGKVAGQPVSALGADLRETSSLTLSPREPSLGAASVNSVKAEISINTLSCESIGTAQHLGTMTAIKMSWRRLVRIQLLNYFL